jgi:predicted AAA+ superfamily ATPase
MLVLREQYWKKIKPYFGNPVIKVITGVRRCGKSYFLRQIIKQLKDQKVTAKNIIYIDRESPDFDFIQDYRDLNQYLKTKLSANKSSKKQFLLIDEVQEISGWEKSLRSIAQRKHLEVFITGSNAGLLSSELATFISGRYIEFQIYPLSFHEFLQFRNSKIKVHDIENEFKLYLKFGSLPGIHHSDLDEEITYPLIKSILNTVILKDVIARHEIRNYTVFESILKFIFDNIGSTFSAKSISDYLKSQRIKVSVETVQEYLKFLEAAYLIYKSQRYDIKGKRHLEIHEKYYIADLGFRHALLGYRNTDINDYLENIIYLELKRRGYEVSTGKFHDLEIDFIASKAQEKIYIQVCYLLANSKIAEREFGVLKKIQDNYPKYVLSMDKFYGEMFDGIQRVNIIDFLTEKF